MFGLRDPLYAMRPPLKPERRVGACTLDRERVFALRCRQPNDGKSAPPGVAAQHPMHVARGQPTARALRHRRRDGSRRSRWCRRRGWTRQRPLGLPSSEAAHRPALLDELDPRASISSSIVSPGLSRRASEPCVQPSFRLTAIMEPVLRAVTRPGRRCCAAGLARGEKPACSGRHTASKLPSRAAPRCACRQAPLPGADRR